MSKTNTGLVNYCKAQLGRPYWMGTFGQVGAEWLYNYNRKRADIAKYYAARDYPKQYGQRVHDCIGLVKGYLWSDTPESVPCYIRCQDHSADSMLTACKERGSIVTLPELPGILVFMRGHVGVYIGGGEVIEARGHAYGVVQTKLKDRDWKNWGKCPYITYESEDDEEMSYEQFKEFMAQYEGEVQERPEPDWSKNEGAWEQAKRLGVIVGSAPDAPMKRCETIAVLSRMGLLK